MEEKTNFENDLKKLNEIVEKIESNELPLNESIKLFEEGNKIIKKLETSLKEAEEKLAKVIDVDTKNEN